jgi:chemotaxis protein CheX
VAAGRTIIMDDSALAHSIQERTDKVFKGMFAMEVNSNGFERRSELQAGNEVLSIIGIRGEWKGSFMLVCDPDSACRLVSTMLGAEIPELNNEVLDGIGELANIVMGNLKDVLEEGNKDVAITPPTVIHGDNMIVRARAKQEWLVVPFTTYNSKFEVRMVVKD